MRSKAKVVLILIAILPALAVSENRTGGQNDNPFATANTVRSGGADVRPSDSGFFSSTSNIVDNSANNAQNGREYKLEDAQRQAGAGMGAAIAAGTSLTAAGMTQLALLNFPEASRLFGLAGMEFAQAGADAGSAAQNKDQRETLLANAGQNGSQSQFNSQALANELLTPETRQALQSQGINPDSFMNSLTSGQVRSGTDAMAAMGRDTSTLSSDQQAALNDYSNMDISSIIGTPEDLGSQDRQLLGVKEDAKPNSDGTAGANSSGSIVQGSGSGSSGSDRVASTTSIQGRGAANGTAGKGAAGGAGRELASLPNGLPGYMGILGVGSQEKDPTAAALARSQLLEVGISKQMRGQNIFRVAFRNYRSFSKWRTLKATPSKAKGIVFARSAATKQSQ